MRKWKVLTGRMRLLGGIAVVLLFVAVFALPFMLSPKLPLQVAFLAAPLALGYLGAGPEQFSDPGMSYILGGEIALNALQQLTLTLNVRDHSFQAWFLTAVSTGTFKCQIKVGGQLITNDFIPNTLLFGNAQNPLPLIIPHVFPKGSQIEFVCIDTSNAGNTIDIALHGKELND